VWLRTFDPRDYQAPIFEEILRGVIERRIAEEGLEPFVQDAMAKSSKGELSALDQHALLATLELHPEAGGEAADLFLDTLRETLDPADLWKAMRMARCFLKRGNEDAALSLYQWCGANASHSRYISYNAVNVTANTLVEELRNNLDGASRIRALDAVLPLVSPDSRMSSSEGGFFQFVLSTWNRELAPHEVYQRCPEICREVIRVDNPTQNNYPQSLELATLFLAAGGEPDEALRGFERLMFRPARTSRSTTNRGDHRDYLLQQCLPEDMSAWTNADRWLAGIARLLQQWEADRKLPTADAVKILSLVAVRQHQNKFEDDAQATLATIGTLSLTNPDAAVWFIDAAGITGNQALAREVATTLLRERRLPVNRVAPLMEAVAAQLGAPAALQLAEETVDYTWERGFLETMVKISTNAKDEDATQIWKNRRQEALKPDAPRPAPPAASADANEAFRQLCEASEAGQHDKTLELGEAFLKTCPHHPEIATALHLAAKAAIATSHRERAVFLLRKIVGDHPAFDAIDEVRFGLAESLSATRALEECIALCRENLEVSPNSSGADYFRFLIPQSQFRLWRFQEAEEGLQAYLAQYPESQYADHAERYLDKINPSWRVDEDGLAEYSGKYEEDYRFKAAVAALPGHIEQGRDMIRERLGVDIDFTGTVNFIFRDAGAGGQGGLMAQTFTVCRDYKPVTVMRFYAEHVVNDPESFRMTVIHEMKHAGFKVLMGRAYDDVPDWISEGLAQWAADQGKSRMTSALNSEAFAGQDPVSLLNGVANPAHDLGDYLEDILAFEWLEKHQPGSVKAFGEGLVQGVPWSELLAATSGLDAEEALRRMDDYCRDRVAAELGEAGQEALALRDTQIAKGNQGSQILKAWLREEGTRRFAEWVDQHPGHVLQPAMRFYTGRGLILAGKFAEGREWLRNLIDSQEGGSLIDDALFYEGYAFQQEKRMGDAERSFRILLRDYSWSSNAPKVRGAFQPAGPEREPSPDATGSNL
jgi:TolA-binding protein